MKALKPMRSAMHIALLGGTFNPIHYGHLRIAEEVAESRHVDKVVFMPTFITPHKLKESLTPPEDRLEMARLAIAGNQRFELSDIEIRRGGRSFTIDTVREFKLLGVGKVSLVVGADSFNEITTWYEYWALFEEASFIVVPRPCHEPRRPEEVLPVELAGKFWYDSEGAAYVNSAGNSIRYLDTILMDISSSEIRERLSKGRSARYLTPDAVIEYAVRKGLYR